MQMSNKEGKLRGYEEFYSSPQTNDWIYIGGDIYNRIWSKVGKTTNGLNTRHRSSQNPGYFIYTAFNIVQGNVHEIESRLLEYLSTKPDLERFVHFSTGNLSECFRIKPNQMTFLAEEFIDKYYCSCVTYENSLHGDMSRYQCRDDIFRYYDDYKNQSLNPMPQPNNLRAIDYFSGNQEEYEIDLGDGYYLDVASCIIKHIYD